MSVGGVGGEMARQDRIDFFISRTDKDKHLAILIARILQAAGYTTLVQDEDFGPESFMAMMAKGWSSGARLICLLSPDYQQSEYCKKEYEVALVGDPRNVQRKRLIVLRVSQCDPIEHLADLGYTDLVPVLHDMEALSRAVRGAVGATKDQAEIDFASIYQRAPKQIVHPNVEENPNFAGRTEDLKGLDAALANPPHAAALSGLGGVGKSTLAREFAWRNRGRYQGVWWIRAERPETLLEDLIELGAHFIPSLKAAKDHHAAARAALDHIWQGKFSHPWLLVYDNVEKPGDLDHLTPRGGAHILITTRWPHWDDARELHVEVFPRDIAVQYLMKRARKSDPEAAGRLAEALGCLPLALDHAGSYLRSGHGTYDGYRTAVAEFLRKKPGKGASTGQYPESVYATFNFALDRVIDGDPDRGIPALPEAGTLMGLLAIFDMPDRFPLNLIPSNALSDIRKGEAAAALQEASLIRVGSFDERRPYVSCHRLVLLTMRSRLENDEARESALENIAFQIGLSRLMELGQHGGGPANRLKALTDEAAEFRKKTAGRFPESLSSSELSEMHALKEAMDAANISVLNDMLVAQQLLLPLQLRKAERRFASDDLELATPLSLLGNLRMVMHRLDEAEQLFSRALAIRKKHLGPDHPDTKSSIDQLDQLQKKRLVGAVPSSTSKHATAPVQAGSQLDSSGIGFWAKLLGRKSK